MQILFDSINAEKKGNVYYFNISENYMNFLKKNKKCKFREFIFQDVDKKCSYDAIIYNLDNIFQQQILGSFQADFIPVRNVMKENELYCRYLKNQIAINLIPSEKALFATSNSVSSGLIASYYTTPDSTLDATGNNNLIHSNVETFSSNDEPVQTFTYKDNYKTLYKFKQGRHVAYFDGRNHMSTPHDSFNNVFQNNETVSIALFMKSTDANISDRQTLVYLNNHNKDQDHAHFRVGINQNGQFYMQMKDDDPAGTNSTFSSGGLLQLNQWHHVVYIHGLVRKIYLDNVLIEDNVGGRNFLQVEIFDNIALGHQFNYNPTSEMFEEQETFIGEMSQVHIYNREITQQEVTDLYNQVSYEVLNNDDQIPDFKFILSDI